MSTMDRPPDDLDELLGAYALDAVSDDERRQVEAYLQANPRARAEVDEYREIAMLLAFGGGSPPDGVWDAIAATLDDRAPEPGAELARVLPAPAPERDRRRWWFIGLAAAAALVVIAALSVALIRKDNGTPATAGGLPGAFAAAKADPANQTVVLATPDGAPQATAVLEPSGSAFVDASTLPALPPDRTYQLWGVLDDGRAVSFAVLGSRPNVAMFGMDGGVKALAITDEMAGGVVAPAKAPTIVGAVH
jgi:anti-sigma-K factor RskA